MKIYVVTSGEYSSYGIEAIFSALATAEAYAAKLNSEGHQSYWNKIYNNANVEEHELDPDEGANPKPLQTIYGASIYLNSGDLAKVPNDGKCLRTLDFRVPPAEFRGAVVNAYSNKSSEHALKVAAEARQAFLRENSITANPNTRIIVETNGSIRYEPLPAAI
jgi:hypothetical protein